MCNENYTKHHTKREHYVDLDVKTTFDPERNYTQPLNLKEEAG